MVLNLATVIGAVSPVIVSTFFSHIKHKKSRADKPVSSLSYEEGLVVVRKFLEYASENTIEDLQRFTSQWIPHPYSVKVDKVYIPEQFLLSAAKCLEVQLGPDGLEEIGGKTWWRWRKPEIKSCAEWIEMRDQYKKRLQGKDHDNRVLFYVHGGAYYFCSVGIHRIQMQKYARMLKARVFAPTYRLAPQYPFPCGLQDCLAAYLYLITIHDPTTIVLAGDSAGGGMILSILVMLRDQNLPLPAGAILISPWVDLTHSFPSILEENPLDYIPKGGFFHKPSKSWPPPALEDVPIKEEVISNEELNRSSTSLHIIEGNPSHGFYLGNLSVDKPKSSRNENKGHNSYNDTSDKIRSHKIDFTIQINGKQVKLVDQIQMYAPNSLLPNPLVSPIFQPSLGGLPPLFIISGGGDPLRDEQIYLAHKAANPIKYPPGDHLLSKGDKEKIGHWKPTYVQLQVWDDMCHVAPILSFARPVQHVYTSIAQFGLRVYDRAQKVRIKLKSDENNKLSINAMLNSEGFLEDTSQFKLSNPNYNQDSIIEGRVGDKSPSFKNYMIRQKVDIHGYYTSLKPEFDLAACNIGPSDLGVVKSGPVLKWMKAKQKWDIKFSSLRCQIQEQQDQELKQGDKIYADGESPPLSALVRRVRVKAEEKPQGTLVSGNNNINNQGKESKLET
ncbi:AB hydrolase superfamily protein C4A8.06c [Erysiphe neolycopersici]|uniref:AB hydrolase superfamily protein C4A8.06c n=1 Tax=Erysiphe neolycopersici TaxID=212602 RepID=A0A420H9V3_9PEZI|nr:AB hydrolase superfamily protein C4A8.06c [Erysiphe neolycopersici]